MRTENIVIPPELQAKMEATREAQAKADQIGIEASQVIRPGAVREAWKSVPDLHEGPYTIRRFKDGDLKRLDEFGHPINSQKAMYEWSTNPIASGPDCWLLLWMMTRPISRVKELLEGQNGQQVIRNEAENEFGELDGYELALLTAKVGLQMATYLGAQLNYEALPAEGQAGPPSSSQPPPTV